MGETLEIPPKNGIRLRVGVSRNSLRIVLVGRKRHEGGLFVRGKTFDFG